MPPLAIARAANAGFSPRTPPIALFLGGTSGVGQAMARGLVRHTSGNTSIIICGRNKAAGQSTLDTLTKTSPRATNDFLECDASLMQNISQTTSILLSRLPKLNFLVLSPGFQDLRGRDDTLEGIDMRLALNYYSRWKFIRDLLPLLREARDAGEQASVMSVLAPGTGWRIDPSDFGLKKRYSILRALLSVPTYNDLMIEAFAEREPGVAFTHIFPGIVRTPLMPSILRPFSYPISVSPEECAEHMIYALLHAGPGAHRMDNKGDDIGKKRYYGSDELRQELWDHTVEEINRVLEV